MHSSSVEKSLSRPETAQKLSDYLRTNPIGQLLALEIQAGGFQAGSSKMEASLSAMIGALKGGMMSGETSPTPMIADLVVSRWLE